MNFYLQPKRPDRRIARQQGLSLIELMVAMSLGIFLTWGATQAFLTGKQTYTMQQATSRIQENGRIAQEFLGYDVRGAGTYGCASGQYLVPGTFVNSLTNPTKTELNFTNGVWGSESGASTDFATALNPVPLANTDILVVHKATNLGLTVLPSPAPTATQITVNDVGLVLGDYLAIGNCTSVTIVKPTAIAVGSSKATITLPATTYSGTAIPAIGASVMKVEAVIYYVANNTSVPSQPALYSRSLADGNTSQELLTGVENMQLEYGIQNVVNVTTAFNKADAIAAADWTSVTPIGTPPKVSAVRYSLLMRSADELLQTPQSYTYNGVAVTATDRRLRQVFTGTVGIRGHLQ